MVEIQNESKDLLTNVYKGKQVCRIRISHLKFSNMNNYCRCFHKVNKFQKSRINLIPTSKGVVKHAEFKYDFLVVSLRHVAPNTSEQRS